MARSSGGWRHGRVQRIKVDEYSVGPQNVDPSGSNYRGAGGAGYADIKRMLSQAKKDGAHRITVAALIRRTSKDKGFRWVSRSGYDVDAMLEDLDDASIERGVDIDEFAREVFMNDYPTSGAITWTVIGY